MLVYADGSALVLGVLDTPDAPAWRSWVAALDGDLCTSAGALTRMRSLLLGSTPAVKRAAEDAVVGVEVLGVSDQALSTASHASTVIDPFRAIDVGIVARHPDVELVASYDALFCRVIAVYGLRVVSPGRPNGWWD